VNPLGKSRKQRRAERFTKSPADMAGRMTSVTHPGVSAGTAPTGPQNLQGSRANAVIPSGQGPTRYDQMAGKPPPNTISDVDLGRNIWSPFQPVAPFGPPYINYPRTYDYPVGANIDFTTAGRLSFFKMLQVLSRSWGILRAVIETRKDQLMRIPWSVQLIGKPKEKGVFVESSGRFCVDNARNL
jgi:hypothetical protein